MSEHTKEWRVVEHPNGWTIQTADGECIAQQYGGSEITHPRRIVACVNACAGIDNITLENAALIPRVKATFDALMDSHAYNKQLQSANAELVAWCGDLHKALLNLVVEVDANKMLVSASTHSMINAALAKHKGGGK